MRKLLATCCLLIFSTAVSAFELKLPTANENLFKGKPELFYMYVDRNFEGEVSRPWQGGAFGFVRTPRRVGNEVVMTRFHEGIDISPVKRDRVGNPLDIIMSISDGVVVYVNSASGRSNYGRYLVVEHTWDDVKIYSLYAHLSKISVKPGDKVRTGSALGQMGFTGRGLSRARSHLHLEVGFLMSEKYDEWHAANFGSINYHGVFNGMNMSGVDVASLFLEHRKNPDLTFREFVKTRKTQFKVLIPAQAVAPRFLLRHQWMREAGSSTIKSWEVGFAATGHPISFTPSEVSSTEMQVSQIRPSKINQSYRTRGLISGNGGAATLTRNGKRLVSLVMERF